MAEADEAMEVKAGSFDKTMHRAVRGSKRAGCDDPVFKISKQPFIETDICMSSLSDHTFLVRKPASDMGAILARVEQLETDSKLLKEGTMKLEAEFKSQKESIAKMHLRIDLMDLDNYDLYMGKIGANRRVVAYGILEFVHHDFLNNFVRTAITERCGQFSVHEKNLFLKFLNKEVFSNKWEQGNYEEALDAWSVRSKVFSDDEVAWLEEILLEAEKKLIATGEKTGDLKQLTTVDLRRAFGRTLSLERTKRNTACHFLSLGDEGTCLEVVEDLMMVLNNGQLDEDKEMTQIMMFGCKLYKSFKSMG